MLATILKYGTLAGLIVGAWLFAVAFLMKGHAPSNWGMVLGYLSMLVALSFVFVAIKRRRDLELGGVIRFWPAFGMGLAISLVASVLYVLAWEAAVAMSGMDFAGDYARALIAQEQARGVSAEALAAFTAQMEQFKLDYARPSYRLPMTFAEIFPVGVLVSLVSAGLLRNRGFMALPRG
jgi:hypothetical protein